MYKLFLDDLREVSDIWKNGTDKDFVVARSYEEAMNIVAMTGIPIFISFDNDLGENEKEGYDFAKALVELDLDGVLAFPEGFCFEVHSANCKAWANIESYLKNYLHVKRIRKAETAQLASIMEKPYGCIS